MEVIGEGYTHPRIFDRSYDLRAYRVHCPGTQPLGGDRFSQEISYRGCGGAGVPVAAVAVDVWAFGHGGAGAVFRRSQPSRF
jgi:hypothetical protein